MPPNIKLIRLRTVLELLCYNITCISTISMNINQEGAHLKKVLPIRLEVRIHLGINLPFYLEKTG